MGNEQYQRQVSLTITNLVTGLSIEVTGLRVTFDISKKPKTDQNRGVIKIHNLSRSSRGLIDSTDDASGAHQTRVELRVGYRAKTPAVAFRGRCKVESTYQAPNWVTTLEGTDGATEMRSFTFEKTYPKGHQVQKILEDIAAESKLAKHARSTTIPDTIPRSRAFTGPATKTVDDLSAKYGFTFDIQDEQYLIRAATTEIPRKLIVVLDKATGLIGRPRKRADLVLMDCLINPEIRPNGLIDLLSTENSDLNGEYKVLKVDMKGDSWSGPWTMHIEGQLQGILGGPLFYVDGVLT